MQAQHSLLNVRECEILKRLLQAEKDDEPWQRFGTGWETTARNLCDRDFLQEDDKRLDGVHFRITGRGKMALAQQTPRAPEALPDNEASSSPDKTLSKPEGSDGDLRRESLEHACVYQQALTILALAYSEVNQLVDALDAIHRRAGK